MIYSGRTTTKPFNPASIDRRRGRRTTRRRGSRSRTHEGGGRQGKGEIGRAAARLGCEGPRLAGALGSLMRPELKGQVSATVRGTDKRAAVAWQEALEAAQTGRLKWVKGVPGLGGSLALLATQRDAGRAGSAVGEGARTQGVRARRDQAARGF